MLVLGACLVLVGCSVCVCVCASICMCVCGFRLCRRDSMQMRCVTRAPIFDRLIINFLFIVILFCFAYFCDIDTIC